MLGVTFPRGDRLILDMDGMYNPVLRLDGYDRNHDNEAERARWFEYFDALADRVYKPTIAPPASPRGSRCRSTATIRRSRSTRGGARRRSTTSCMSAITGGAGATSSEADTGVRADPQPDRRDRLHRVVVGQAAAEGPARGTRCAFKSDPAAFKRLDIETPQVGHV